MATVLLGCTGYVGSNLAGPLAADAAWSCVNLDLRLGKFDLLDEFDTVVNAAGKADIDLAGIDSFYAANMVTVNAWAVQLLSAAYRGYLVHISSPLALFAGDSLYARTKRAADAALLNRPNTLIVYPCRFVEGDHSHQFDAVLRRQTTHTLVVDNVHRFNPTPMPWFSKTVAELVRKRTTGEVLLYDTRCYTAASYLKEQGVWGPSWVAGEYVDLVPRPKDISFSGRFAGKRHITV